MMITVRRALATRRRTVVPLACDAPGSYSENGATNKKGNEL